MPLDSSNTPSERSIIYQIAFVWRARSPMATLSGLVLNLTIVNLRADRSYKLGCQVASNAGAGTYGLSAVTWGIFMYYGTHSFLYVTPFSESNISPGLDS